MAIERNDSALANWIRKTMYNDGVRNRSFEKSYMPRLKKEFLNLDDDDILDFEAEYNNMLDQAANDPLSFKRIDDTVDGVKAPSAIGTTATLAWDKVRAHPWKTAGLGVGAAANLAGLFDNPNIAGQLVGAGAGTAVPFLLNKFAGTNIGGYGKVMSGLIGGGLGSLFDTLMAKKQEQQQQYGGY